MSAQVAADAQPNGVVRPQEVGAQRASGDQSSEAGVEIPTVPIQTADEFLAEVQGRVRTEEAGSGAEPKRLQAERQTAANMVHEDTGAVESLAAAGPFVPEVQTGMETGSQGAAYAGNLVEQRAGAELDPSANFPVEDVHSDFQTPRSRLGSHLPGLGSLRGGAPAQWPGWVSRLGDLFKAPPIPNTWLPSPIPSPPPPPIAGGQWTTQQAFTGRAATTMDAGKGYPKGRKGANLNTTPSSSSIPAEAIQAEVQRQMGNLLTRLSEVENDNARLQLELREEKLKSAASAAPAEHPHASLPQGDPAPRAGGSAVYPGNESAVPAVPGSRGDPWNKLWEGITGMRTSRTPQEIPVAPVPPTRQPAVPDQLPPRTTTTAAATGEHQSVIEALAESMRQLQELQMKAMIKNNDPDDTPEVVKTAVTVLPTLGQPEGDQCGLVFQDWVVQVTTAMQDLSASSGSWWESVKKAVVQAYTQWLGSSPLERLGIEPDGVHELVSGKWVRINARSCAMIVQAVPEAVKTDLIARRSTQSMPLLLFRLYTLYQPGGAGERAIILQKLQGGHQPRTVEECLQQLRAWPRWLQRCQDMGMAVPDGSVLAKGLTLLTSSTIERVPDAMFRTQLVRATLRIDQQPSLQDVLKYQRHLQAERESFASSISTTITSPAVRAAGVSVGGQQTIAGGTKPGCKYFLRQSGCRRGAKCPYPHDLSGLTKVERSRKCLACGSEEHRQKECPTRAARSPPARSTQGGAEAGRPSDARTGASNEPESETSPKTVAAVDATPGQPVLSWEALLQAAVKIASPATEPKAPSLRVLSIRGLGTGKQAFALVDSGATHPLRRAIDYSEWKQADPVQVHLAGGEIVELRMNKGGTLLVPDSSTTRTTSTAPIVPLGSLVAVLGYKMEWHGTRCRLTSKEGEILNLRVRDGCPEITEQQALELIAKLEDQKLQDLKYATAVTKGKIRESVIALNKSWFDHLVSYCGSGIGTEALLAIKGAPFFQDLPQEALYGLSEADPCSNGWEALKGLQHLNRRRRKALWSSRQWVVHLYSGKQENPEIMFLERQGFTVLEIDLERGKTHDVCNPLVWRALEWGARNGRIASVVGGPPQNTFMLRRCMTPGPEAVRSNSHPYGGWYGQSEKERAFVNRHTGLFVKMIYLHALATAGRTVYPAEPNDVKEVGFMLEQPKDPRAYLLYSDPLSQDCASFWRTSLWEEYSAEAGLSTVSFDMSSLGKALIRHTTLGTNLPLRHLDGLPGRVQDDPYPPERAPPSVWSRSFSEAVSIAIREQRMTPRMLKMSAEQWKEHVRRGHLPFRSDCMTCVTAGATGRRHARVEHPSCFVLSADVSGPLKVPGLDADARGAFPKPHKYPFVAKLRVPKTFLDDGRGVGLEYDSGELDADVPVEEGSFDYEEPKPEVAEDPPLDPDDGGEVLDGDDSDEPPPQQLGPEEDIDLVAPETVNLIFASAIPDNKGSTVLEAIQDVVLYCWALNIPIVRFHCDRGMEFYAKATRQWIKFHGMRFTTSEGGLHQQNGMVENAVRYVKQRARTLLIGAKLPQKLWPQAVAMAASSQRATTLGMETRLAAPFGAKVLVRRREYGGTAEPGKPDDLAPRWLEGRYLGLSETVRRGHVVYLAGDDGEKFVHTVNVRVGVEDSPSEKAELEADLPGSPSRRVRGKARGSGDIVAISRAKTVVGSEDLKARAVKVLDDWSQEEAEKLIVHVGLSLDPGDRKFGVFRHGGSVGLTRVTYDKPWFTELLVRAMKEKCPDAEFSALYLSVNTPRDVHVDSNNLTGVPNYVYPIVVPSRGGSLWIELRDGDVVRGKISEMIDQCGKPRFGCTQPLTEGKVVIFDPHRRHAVLPWKGLRVVLIAYTPGVPQNISGVEREVLSRLGFPVPPEVEMSAPSIAVRSMSVGALKKSLQVQEDDTLEYLDWDRGFVDSEGNVLFEPEVSSGSGVKGEHDELPFHQTEELEQWDMFLPLAEGDPQVVPKVAVASCDGVPSMSKAEVTFTKNIEKLLESLKGPLTVVHNVNPTEAAEVFDKWIPSVKKELGSFEAASTKVESDDPSVISDLREGKAKIVPMKLVYTVKPPDDEVIKDGIWFRRKARIVACGNLIADSGEQTYAGAAPAEVVRSSLSISSLKDWEAAVLDVTAAFLQTPLKEVQCQQRILGQPPRVLVRAGLCGDKELWEYTHAVYGLRESPRWWGEFRDAKLAQLNVVVGDRKIRLHQCRVEGSWWRLEEDSVLVGLIVVYVDDLLICSIPPIIQAVSTAIKELWKTSSLSWASNGIRFLGIEIVKVDGGYALNQGPYIQELVRIHELPPSRKDLIPVARDQAYFEAAEEETVFTEQEIRAAQQIAGEILWVSQRTRPDVAYTASLISSLSARAPRRAVGIGLKCLGYLQRTAGYHLRVQTHNQVIAAWTDASFAPEGAKSHTGWMVMIGDTPVSWRSSRQTTVTLSTAESELAASVEGALALVSIEALVSELGLGIWESVLRTDSTSSLAIQQGSGSWRTRHLRIKSNWIGERIEAGDLAVEHWPGEQQLADALTKALSSIKLRELCRLIGLMSLEEIREAGRDKHTSSRSSKAEAPSSLGFKVLIAMMVLAQAIPVCEASAVTVYEPMTVDHGLVAWCVFAVMALLWTLAWELIKFAGWQLYYSAAPGASSRRMRRLQRIRDSTAEAIRSELDQRRRIPTETRRAFDADREYGSQAEIRHRTISSSSASGETLGKQRLAYRANQKDKAVQTSGPAFAPVVPEIRTEVRREVRIPEQVHIVPGNQCYHVFNPCHAFRHRGTQGRVQTLRICEYCVRHQGRDPLLPGPGIDEILGTGQMPRFDRPGVAMG